MPGPWIDLNRMGDLAEGPWNGGDVQLAGGTSDVTPWRRANPDLGGNFMGVPGMATTPGLREGIWPSDQYPDPVSDTPILPPPGPRGQPGGGTWSIPDFGGVDTFEDRWSGEGDTFQER